MKKVIILIPVFNDWDSLKKLTEEINENIKDFKDINFECLIVNDASTVDRPKLIKPNHIKSFEILNMKKNKGHARCNAFGIRYIFQNKQFDHLILMDGDGEDRPVEIKSLINTAMKSQIFQLLLKELKDLKALFFNFFIKFIN